MRAEAVLSLLLRVERPMSQNIKMTPIPTNCQLLLNHSPAEFVVVHLAVFQGVALQFVSVEQPARTIATQIDKAGKSRLSKVLAAEHLPLTQATLPRGTIPMTYAEEHGERRPGTYRPVFEVPVLRNCAAAPRTTALGDGSITRMRTGRHGREVHSRIVVNAIARHLKVGESANFLQIAENLKQFTDQPTTPEGVGSSPDLVVTVASKTSPLRPSWTASMPEGSASA
jgi:hypothetical protein